MEVNNLLKSVNNLNEYIHISNDVALNCNDIKIQFNMSTILALKKVRSFEIEYFNKVEENGAAIKIFELLLRFPPSKTWNLLGRELIFLLQYWLDAMRKHLIFHNNNWWSFLQVLLKFIKEIRIKDNKSNNILLEVTAECLLDLATHSKPDVIQRHDILCLFNLCGADSSREIRFALRKQLDSYFVRLSGCLTMCGDVAMQYSILEALLRWLLPRQDKAVRMEAADKWFPGRSTKAVGLFLDRQWLDFFQDARDFLNAYNTASDLITSVVCKRLCVGNNVVIGSGGTRIHWLDMNLITRRLSITLEPKDLENLGGELTSCCGTLVLTEALSLEVKFGREGSEAIVSMVNCSPPLVVPSLLEVTVKELHVTITICADGDMANVDTALRKIFGLKYQVLFDVNKNVVASKVDECSRAGNDTEEDKIFSNNTEPKRRRHVGYIVNSKRSGALASPSTASTSSLAQLHDKLAALPRFNYEKESVSVCARPQLSNVTELSDEDRQSLNTSVSTIKLRPYGVCQKSAFSKPQIDGKVKQKESKCLSPAVVDENSVSCLLVATIGSADESVISDTLERFPQNKDNTDNIVDLLVLEAFQSKNAIKDIDGTNHEKKEIHNNTDVKDAIESSRSTKGRACTVISNSSHTEESNAEFVEGTQFTNVNFDNRKKGKELPLTRNAHQAFDEKAVEEFFSQHFAENRDGDLVISPTLAKKINETSSETSEEFDADKLNFESRELLEDENKFIEQTVPNIDTRPSIKEKEVNFDAIERVVPDLEVIECVNFILDRICFDFTLCQEVYPNIDSGKAEVKENSSKTGIDTKEPNIKTESAKVTKKKTAKGVKLKFSSNKNTRTTRQKNKLKLAEPSEGIYKIDQVTECCTPPIENVRKTRRKNKQEVTEQPKVILETKAQDKTSPNVRNVEDTDKNMKEIGNLQDRNSPNITDNKHDNTVITPIARRKRKLYSPKDEKCINNEITAIDDAKSLYSEEITSDTASEFRPYEKKKQITYYKQIEQDRKNYRKKLRNRKLLSIDMEMSPKSKKLNEAFDHLKKGVEDNEQIILANKSNINDIAAYNFTSDSEDEDFKKKTPKRKTDTIKVEVKQNKNKVQPKRKRANRSKTRAKIEKLSDSLVDERMREPVVGLLNTSIEPRKSSDTKCAEIPILTVEHELEPIEETIDNRKIVKKQNKIDKNATIGNAKIAKLNETDRTESPLPGLLVEATVPTDSMLNESVTVRMMQKFQEIYERKSINESERDSTRNLTDAFSHQLNMTETSDNVSKDYEKIDNIGMDYKNTTKPSSPKEESSPFQKQKRKRKNSNDSVNDKSKSNKSLRDLKEKEVDAVKPKVRNLSRKTSSNLSMKDRKTKKASKILEKRNKTEPNKNKTPAKNYSTSSLSHRREEDSEVINVSGAYSEKSFETVGHSPITAHGDINLCENDLPPSQDSLKRNLEPRNLEVEDLDESIREFFTELNKEIAEGTFGVRNLVSTSDSSTNKSNKKEDVRATRKFKDNNNESNEGSSNKVHDLKQSKSILRLSDISNIENESNKSSVVQLKSPLVSVARLSSGEINKWLLPRPKSEDGTPSGTPTKRPNRISNTGISKGKKKDSSKSKKTAKNTDLIIVKKQKTGRFVSSISPIKLFDELKPLKRRNTGSSSSMESEKILRMSTKITSPVASTHNTKVEDYCDVRSSSNSNDLVKSFVSDVKITSTQTSGKTLRVENFGSQRDPSMSSVDDWFSRIGPRMDQEEAMTVGFKDNVSSIMEKLDTTLVEIHHDTSKRLAAMFTEAQAKLLQAKRERRLLYQKSASDLLSGVLRLVDEHFAELDKKSQEMDEKFMLELKEKSRNLIREDCTRKKAMVRLLKEDVQAVMDFNSKVKRPKMK